MAGRIGTIKMGGNRKHGFRRGNANGRTKPYWVRPFFCAGCGKMHGERVERTGIAGKLFCERTYYKESARLRSPQLPLAL